MTLCLQSDHMEDLEKLFNPEFRQMEAEALADTEENLKRTKNYFAPTTTTSIVEALVSQNELQTQFNDYMSFVPKSSHHSPLWTKHSAILSLGRVVRATAILPDITNHEVKTAILERSLRWEIARSYLLLYSWYRQTGPQLAQTLMDIHKSGYPTVEGGYPILHRAHPTFAPLVHHIVSYVITQANETHTAKKAKQRSKLAVPRNTKSPATLHSLSPMQISPAELPSLPFDLYGLRDGGSSRSKRIPLRLPRAKVALKDVDAIYRCSATILQDIWSNELILPPMASMEKNLGRGQQKDENIHLVKCKAITRGAVLQCIIDACGGDESILASSDIEAIIHSPSKIFSSRIEKPLRFAPAVLKDPQTTLAPLSEWIAQELDKAPAILDFAARTARTVHRGLLELHYGVTLSEEHYLNPYLLYDDSEDVPFIAPAISPRQSPRKRNTYYAPPTLENLLPDPKAPYFGAIGLILRERCNELRGLNEADPLLRNVLVGKHPTQGRVMFDRDQTDPARQYSEYAKLLAKSLPATKLTGRLGISRLLAYMGTGQGNKTATFVTAGLNADEDDFPMAFESLDKCVSHFETTEIANMVVLSDNHAKAGSRAAHLPGYIQTYNACIWGQASNHLLLQPTLGKGNNKRRYTLEMKFAPYFSDSVQDKWYGWLGDLADKDPAIHPGLRKSWASALRFIIDLKILGFQTGLTPLQFANNLVFLGICTPPAPEEVASWIASNKTLGAYNGLVKLGFQLTGYDSIVAAYMVVYNHLDMYLSTYVRADDKGDKERLGFGSLFVEHVLCKVGRWDYRLRLQKHNFLSMAEEATILQGSSWKSRANATNCMAFPIPLKADRAAIKTTLESYLVQCFLYKAIRVGN